MNHPSLHLIFAYDANLKRLIFKPWSTYEMKTYFRSIKCGNGNLRHTSFTFPPINHEKKDIEDLIESICDVCDRSGLIKYVTDPEEELSTWYCCQNDDPEENIEAYTKAMNEIFNYLDVDESIRYSLINAYMSNIE